MGMERERRIVVLFSTASIAINEGAVRFDADSRTRRELGCSPPKVERQRSKVERFAASESPFAFTGGHKKALAFRPEK
jgi:hypothetical protein